MTHAPQHLAQRTRTALGLPAAPLPRVEFGESATCLMTWSVRELDHLYGQTGGTVTVVETEIAGTLHLVVETMLSEVPGPVRLFIDWTPAEEVYGFALPVVRDATTTAAA
ncbi:hypothetical protein [Streptomyces sp. NPDC057702]|uniref:hypothetical protein n=1 Tax=Streptomyces sp. NPDC057702 TaxID=3346221 RepID=UPI0036922B3B